MIQWLLTAFCILLMFAFLSLTLEGDEDEEGR